MKRIIVAVLAAWLLTGCGQKWCERRYPIVSERDVTFEKDSAIYVPGAVLEIQAPTDQSVIIEKYDTLNKVRLKVRVDTLLDVVAATCEKEPDTIIVTKVRRERVITRVPVEKAGLPWYCNVLWIISGFAVGFILRALSR